MRVWFQTSQCRPLIFMPPSSQSTLSDPTSRLPQACCRHHCSLLCTRHSFFFLSNWQQSGNFLRNTFTLWIWLMTREQCSDLEYNKQMQLFPKNFNSSSSSSGKQTNKQSHTDTLEGKWKKPNLNHPVANRYCISKQNIILAIYNMNLLTYYHHAAQLLHQGWWCGAYCSCELIHSVCKHLDSSSQCLTWLLASFRIKCGTNFNVLSCSGVTPVFCSNSAISQTKKNNVFGSNHNHNINRCSRTLWMDLAS